MNEQRESKPPRTGLAPVDYFAARALQGLLASGDFSKLEPEDENGGVKVAACVVNLAYQIAQEMMRASEASKIIYAERRRQLEVEEAALAKART